MASVHTLPSGRFRGRFRANGVQHTKTFDYEFEAMQWAEDGERRAQEVTAPRADTNHDETPKRGAANGTNVAATPAVSQVTVAEYGKRWLARTWGEREAESNKWYTTQLRAISAAPLGKMPIGSVAKADVQAFMSADAMAGVGAPSRVARLKTLRTIMRDALENEAVLREPTAGVRKPTVQKRPPANPKAATLAALLDACEDDETRLVVLLALDAGLRWGEAAGIPAEGVVLDEANPRLWIGQVALRNRTIRGYPKGHRARWVPITTERLADALRARVEHVGDSGLLFTARDGRPMSYWASRDKWYAARAAVGMPSLRFHDLRHVFGSDLGNAGVPRRDIATVLGHADESTTAGYLHGNDNADIFAAARKAKAAGR